MTTTTTTTEYQALWAAVEANQQYKRWHPDEELEVFETGADFLHQVHVIPKPRVSHA